VRTPTAPLAGRRRVVAALAGAGLLMAATPVLAQDADEADALVLLVDAAEASRSLSYSGTQYVASWGPAETTTALVEVQHAPGRGVRVLSTAGSDEREPVVLPSAALDEGLLEVLSDRYRLRTAGQGRSAGRAAEVVEAVRPGTTGRAAVAARFWVDRETGLMLRREVFDREGRRMRSSAFLDLSVVTPTATLTRAAQRRADDDRADDAGGDPVPESRLRRMRADGEVVPASLPGGFALFDARSRLHGDAEVLHLAYSDGLSTTSLFSQPGELGSAPPDGFAPRTVAGQPVWASTDAPARMVWAGSGRVWTLVSDAPPDAVEQAVGALPHEAMPDVDTGWRARLARGLARLAGALNPFS
jgi:sigma-E factor negative regulatory protein RseB